MRSIHDFLRPQVDIVILGQCDKMYRPKTTYYNCIIIFQLSLLNHQFSKELNIPIKSLKQIFFWGGKSTVRKNCIACYMCISSLSRVMC